MTCEMNCVEDDRFFTSVVISTLKENMFVHWCWW